MQIRPIQQNKTSFKAKLFLEGNKKLLKKGQEKALRIILDKVATASDDVIVRLPNDSASSGTIWLSRYCISNIDYNCLNVKAYYDNNDAFTGIINGLNKMNFREHIYKPNAEEYACPKYDVRSKVQREEIVNCPPKIEEEVKDDMSIKGPTLADIYPRVSSWKQQLLEDYFYGRFGIED